MQCRGSTKEMSTHERNSCFFLCVGGLTLQGLLLTVRSRCVLMLVTCVSRLCCLSGRRRGLTLAESPRVVDVLLAHVTRSSPLEAPIGEDVTSCLGELQTTRWREHRTPYMAKKINKKNPYFFSYPLFFSPGAFTKYSTVSAFGRDENMHIWKMLL